MNSTQHLSTLLERNDLTYDEMAAWVGAILITIERVALEDQVPINIAKAYVNTLVSVRKNLEKSAASQRLMIQLAAQRASKAHQ